MITALRSLRAVGVPLLLCAEKIGVSYPLAVYKARELGLSQRLNCGRTPGHHVAAGDDLLRLLCPTCGQSRKPAPPGIRLAG
jgi:hypothetical protein